MENGKRAFLEDLLGTRSPSGYEAGGQRVWVEYVRQFADDVWTDEYGNAVGVHEGSADMEIAIGGHADEIGYAVSSVTEEGFVRIIPVGGADPTVSRGTQIVIETDEGPVNGVIGQTAIHLRNHENPNTDDVPEISAQHVDIGAEDEEDARNLVEIGDPATVAFGVHDLANDRLAARGLDNRVGTWVAAETLRRSIERDVDATVYAVSTIQEEVGLKGAQMVGFDLEPDAIVAVDVTHASDNPAFPSEMANDVSLGEGPVIARGTANHPELVDAVRTAAETADIDVQLQATGIRTGTDADAYYTQRGGIPSLNLGIPNRYMHTPAEVIDLGDVENAAALLSETAGDAADRDGFQVDL
ncbi:MAG: M20/M25/M40 family metallo-hydrolase [Halodesulfurarchaeum sp.]